MKNDPRTCVRAGMRIFAFDPIFYVLFLFTAVFGYNTSIKSGRKNNGRKNYQ